MASSSQPYPYSGSGTRPSPPSPSLSSPGLTQSTSNSSCSPPQPSTPPRRQNTRQSDQGRIPLHRRGTSRTYENLEDLLREAGYKETRIYTPDSDRIEPHANDEEGSQPSGKVQGMRAAVVGFLTNLVTGTGNDTVASKLRQDQATSHGQRPPLSRTQSPPSPLQQMSSCRWENVQSMESVEPQTPSMTSSIESLGEPTPRANRRQAPLHRQIQTSSQPSTPYSPEARSSSPAPRCLAYSDHHHTQDLSLLPHHLHRHQHHRISAAPKRSQNQPSWSAITTPSNNNVTPLDPSSNDQRSSTSNNSTIVINDPAPSRAGTYLRHVMSTPPTIPPKSPYRNQSNNGTEGPSRKWLDSVARVLMFGASTTPLGYVNPPTSPIARTPNTSQLPSAPAFPSHIQRPSSFNHHLHFQHQHYYQHHHHNHHHHPHHRTLRPSRSSISQTTYRSALSASTTMTARPRLEFRDQINANVGALTPPVFLTRFGRERAPCSQSQVSKTRVYCRSAPASRAPSPSRSTFYFYNKNDSSNHKKNGLRDISNSSGGGRVGRGSDKRGHYHAHRGGGAAGSRGRIGRRKKGDEEGTRVPSLAKTRVEGDGWHKGGGKDRRMGGAENNNDPFSSSDNHHHHHHTHHHHHHYHHSSPRHDDDNDGKEGDEFHEDGGGEDYDDDTEDDEEEEEGELDLAKMLVNPKRQQSIRSLRKHLHHSQQQLLTSPIAFTDSSKPGDSSSSHAAHLENNNNNTSITKPSLSRLRAHNHHHPSPDTTQQRRPVSGRQTRQADDDAAGQWERQWRSGELSSSRRGSADDDLYESPTGLNDDKDSDNKNSSRPRSSTSTFQGPR